MRLIREIRVIRGQLLQTANLLPISLFSLIQDHATQDTFPAGEFFAKEFNSCTLLSTETHRLAGRCASEVFS